MTFKPVLIILRLVCLLTFSGLPIVSSGDESKPGDREEIRVMSFNVRLGVAKDGPNHWDKRKDLVVEAISRFNPDLLGTQETWGFQASFLKESFPGYTYYGVGRQVNPQTGEQCGLMFRSERFELLEKGTFWLSKTPLEPGSKSWDSSLPRIASWVRLRERKDERMELLFLNTHFDHRGREAREKGAEIIRDYVARQGVRIRTIITGDFNAAEGSRPYLALTQKRKDDSVILLDSYRLAYPEKKEGEGTFSAWNGKRSSGRIDWVLHSRHFRTQKASIDRFNQSGRYPSDHYPVTAILQNR